MEQDPTELTRKQAKAQMAIKKGQEGRVKRLQRIWMAGKAKAFKAQIPAPENGRLGVVLVIGTAHEKEIHIHINTQGIVDAAHIKKEEHKKDTGGGSYVAYLYTYAEKYGGLGLGGDTEREDYVNVDVPKAREIIQMALDVLRRKKDYPEFKYVEAPPIV